MMMKQKLLCILVIVLAALWFNRVIFSPPPALDRAHLVDNVFIVQGADRIKAVGDTTRWITGAWIHDSDRVQNWRPLTSYMLFGIVRLGQNYGWRLVDAPVFLAFLAFCFAAAALAYRFTHSYVYAALAGVLTSNLPAYHKTEISPLFWFATTDNFIGIALMLSAMAAWMYWRETARRWALLAAWGCFIAAILTKELGLLTPALLALLSVVNDKSPRKQAVAHLAAMFATSVVFFGLRCLLVPDARPEPSKLPLLIKAIGAWLPPTPFEILMMDNAGVLRAGISYILMINAVVAIWRYKELLWNFARRDDVQPVLWRCGVLWGCVQLSYIPVLGYPLTAHYGYLAVTLKASMWAVATQALLPVAWRIFAARTLNTAPARISLSFRLPSERDCESWRC